MSEFLPQQSWINQIRVPDYPNELKPGWDGYNGRVPTDEAMKVARSMALVPGGDGSLQFELHVGKGSIEIHIAPDGRVDYVHVDCPGSDVQVA